MMKSIDDMKNVIIKKYSELADIKTAYLSEAGLAAMEAYKVIFWHLGFHDELSTLKEDEQFMNLVSIPDKHPEYYKILRTAYRALERV